MTNILLAQRVLQFCWQAGAREVVVCAGARNAPFVSLLSASTPFRVTPFFEERSAGFYALGRILSQGRPVAVITTSGTAAAELLPATIEADYQGLPLLLITADRPRRYRGTGAPQTIHQPGLYSCYVEHSWDGEGAWNYDHAWSLRRPLHLNVCFDEPLLDSPLPSWSAVEETRSVAAATVDTKPAVCGMKMPLVLVGGLPQGAAAAVAATLKNWRRPLYLEGPSNLRGHPDLTNYEITGGEKSLASIQFDGVIRIGGVPTLRLWRDLESINLPVMHFSSLPFSGLPRERKVHSLDALSRLSCAFTNWSAPERHADQALTEQLRGLLGEFPLSETALVQWLSQQIPKAARVFVGNSLPIREWDLAADRRRDLQLFANRGVNGIDGLVSTFMGLCEPQHANWCVIGDLSALYDLSGLWPARASGWVKDLNVVVINNGGGKIFHPLFHNPLFENRHALRFANWAEMWGWDYLLVQEPETLQPAQRPRVIEILPDLEQSDAFNKLWSRQ